MTTNEPQETLGTSRYDSSLDVGVERSDRRRRLGKLTKQGSPQLRWALYESAQSACQPTSPDHVHYQAHKQRGLSHTPTSLTIARLVKLSAWPGS